VKNKIEAHLSVKEKELFSLPETLNAAARYRGSS